MKRSLLQLLGRSGTALALLLAVLAPPLPSWADGPADAAEEPEARKVRSITWHGVESVETADLERSILTAVADWRPWVEDRPFDAATLEQDAERVRMQLVRTGFYEAAVETRWEPARRNRVDVHIVVV